MNRSDIERLASIPRMEDAVVSPDAQWVAWSWFGLSDGGCDTYVASTDGEAGPFRIGAPGGNARVVSWTADSRSVVVRRDTDGDERARLLRIDLDRREKLVPLTAPDPNYFVRGGSLLPDGRTLVYGANVDLGTGFEIEPTCVLRCNIETGACTELARPARGGTNQPKPNADGSFVLYSRSDRHPAGAQVWLVDITGSRNDEIINLGDDVNVQAEWFPDGRRIAVLAEDAAKQYRKIGVWDLATRRTCWILDDPALNIEQIRVPPPDGPIVALDIRKAHTRSLLVDPNTGAWAEPFSVPGDLVLLAPLRSGAWVARLASTGLPTDLIRISGAPDAPHLTSLSRAIERTAVDASHLAAAESFHWTSTDGLEVQGWLYRPQGPAHGTIVCVHGGPTWHCGDELDVEPQCYCAAGFNVLVPNYRGSTGFSLAYQDAIREGGWGSMEQIDIRCGIEALFDAGIALPGKVGMTGLSYGGYSTWFAITRFPRSIVAAAAPVCGMTDLVVDYRTTRPDLRPLSERMMGGAPEDVPEKYRERSPIHFIDHIEGRLLIVQGRRDPNVTPEHVEVVRPLLDRAGVDYEILWFDDEGHGIEKRENQMALFRRLVAFFEDAFSETPQSPRPEQDDRRGAAL